MLDPLNEPNLCRTASPQGQDPLWLCSARSSTPQNVGSRQHPACGTNATQARIPVRLSLSRRQALRRSGQSDGPKPCNQRRAALALLHSRAITQRSQLRCRIHHARPSGQQIKNWVFGTIKSIIASKRSNEGFALSRFFGLSGGRLTLKRKTMPSAIQSRGRCSTRSSE